MYDRIVRNERIDRRKGSRKELEGKRDPNQETRPIRLPDAPGPEARRETIVDRPFPPVAKPHKHKPPVAPEPETEQCELETRRLVGVLAAVEGDLEGQFFAVRDGENLLGRSKQCDVVLSSPRISREHVAITHANGCFAVHSMPESKPAYVNGEVTEAAQLSDGDRIKLGTTTFRFRTV